MSWGPWDGSTVLILIICIAVAISYGALSTFRKRKDNRNDSKKK